MKWSRFFFVARIFVCSITDNHSTDFFMAIFSCKVKWGIPINIIWITVLQPKVFIIGLFREWWNNCGVSTEFESLTSWETISSDAGHVKWRFEKKGSWNSAYMQRRLAMWSKVSFSQIIETLAIYLVYLSLKIGSLWSKFWSNKICFRYSKTFLSLF